jgi:uncharacterized protein (UPF0548 family)
MALHRRRPTEAQLDRLLATATGAALTYAPAGCSLGAAVPSSFRRRQWEATLPDGASFDRAVHTLRRWGVQRGAGLVLRAEGDVAVGVHVAMAAPLPIGWVEATCRVVDVVDEADRFGFAYGTLPVHPERGEESFLLHRRPLRLVIVAVSRPAHPLAMAAASTT